MSMKSPPQYFALAVMLASIVCSGCSKLDAEQEHHEHQHRIIATSPLTKDVVTTQQYVCQIHSCRHIEVCALEEGYLEEIPVNEGQSIQQGELMFRILPTLYQAKLDAEKAEADLARIEYTNTNQLYQDNVVSDKEVALAKAKLDKAMAQVKLAETEVDFANIKAPFSGIIDRLHHQQGSLIEEGAMLTTLSDNSVMWVYFNVPEAAYLEYQSNPGKTDEKLDIELVLANDQTFPQKGKIGAIEADFDNETGNIAFRADFPNPNGLLRHGQTGNVLIHRTAHGALVIPQRATFEILDKRYVYVIDEDHAVHQREISVLHEMEDIYVVGEGLSATDKIVLEGVRQVREDEEVEFEFSDPQEVLSHLKFQAE